MEGVTMTSVLTTALGTISTDALGMISGALPIALGIAGTVVALRIGWKAFKSFTK